MIKRFAVMLEALDKKFIPQKRGFINSDEIELITDYLKLQEMTLTELENLRDFTVLWYDAKSSDDDNVARFKNMEKVSGITACIDRYIADMNERGGIDTYDIDESIGED